MQALASRCPAKANETKRHQPIAHFERRRDDPYKGHIRRRLEIEDKPAGLIGMTRLAIPRMELKGRYLRGYCQATPVSARARVLGAH